jgi:hypothetical protein
MSLVCPISERKVDENIARLNAIFTFLITTAFVLSPYKWIIFLLMADFMLRRIRNGQLSYITQISRFTSGALRFKKVSINAGPKLFAANIGFFLSVLIAILYYGGVPGLAYGVAGILAFFAFLEAAFNICAACILYPFVSRFM